MTTTSSNTPKIDNIKEWSKVPGSNTYFRTSDVSPFVSEDGQTVTIFNSRGDRRSWGTPSVTSKCYMVDGVLVVDVTGWHKHTVSPVGGTYYFVNENGRWVRRTANHKSVRPIVQRLTGSWAEFRIPAI